jgi:hypothetical protein
MLQVKINIPQLKKQQKKIQAIIDENPELKTAKDFINKKLLTQPDTQK